MLCAREHIHWLYGLYSISVLRKIFKIPRGGGRIAAHHHDALGGHGQYGLQRRLVAALAGRVQNDDIGQQAVGSQFLCGGSGVGTDLPPGQYRHCWGIARGALHRFGYDLYTDKPAAVLRHGKADGTRAAIKVQQRILGAGRGKISGNTV